MRSGPASTFPLEVGTRVHFRRVRPNRSKNGIPTPSNQLVEECYRYMAGNVRAEEIENQQGDLIFIRVDKPGTAVEDPVPVRSFESHAFIPLEGGKPGAGDRARLSPRPTAWATRIPTPRSRWITLSMSRIIGMPGA